MFWRNIEFLDNKIIVSKVLRVVVMLSRDTIAKANGCLHEGSTYYEGWEKAYNSQIHRALYAKKVGDQKAITYNLLSERAKIWANKLNKSVLHKVGSKTTLSDLHKFVLFHLMENLPFDLPNTIYINILCNSRNLGGMDNIYYATLMNKLLWDQGVYHLYDKMDDNSKPNIMLKGSIIAKQQRFNKTNLKATKLAMKEQKEIPLGWTREPSN